METNIANMEVGSPIFGLWRTPSWPNPFQCRGLRRILCTRYIFVPFPRGKSPPVIGGVSPLKPKKNTTKGHHEKVHHTHARDNRRRDIGSRTKGRFRSDSPYAIHPEHSSGNREIHRDDQQPGAANPSPQRSAQRV